VAQRRAIEHNLRHPERRDRSLTRLPTIETMPHPRRTAERGRSLEPRGDTRVDLRSRMRSRSRHRRDRHDQHRRDRRHRRERNELRDTRRSSRSNNRTTEARNASRAQPSAARPASEARSASRAQASAAPHVSDIDRPSGDDDSHRVNNGERNRLQCFYSTLTGGMLNPMTTLPFPKLRQPDSEMTRCEVTRRRLRKSSPGPPLPLLLGNKSQRLSGIVLIGKRHCRDAPLS
jgi:hypothetical protein